MNVTGIFSLKCSHCSEVYDFDDEADFELEHVNEKQMGLERGYVWNHSLIVTNVIAR